jgi:integrase/recombinase XerD
MNKSIHTGIEDFIQLRRSFGFKYERGGQNLYNLSQFLKKRKKNTLNTRSILDWLESHWQSSGSAQSARMCHAHDFAKYWKVYDSRTEVPDRSISNHAPRRSIPYIYSPAECKCILRACCDISAPRAGKINKLYAHAFYSLYGLIMSTGLRRKESVNLKREHINLKEGTLFVEVTKFRKARLIPLHATTISSLKHYAKIRDRIIDRPKTDYFFLIGESKFISNDMIYYRFVRICHDIKIRNNIKGHGPRIHDLRHTFAVRIIQSWLKDKKNIHELMPILSTVMGHDHPSDTYWYLTGVPEILKHGLNLEKT